MADAEEETSYSGFTIKVWVVGKRTDAEGRYAVTNPAAPLPQKVVATGAILTPNATAPESLRAATEAAKAAIDNLK